MLELEPSAIELLLEIHVRRPLACLHKGQVGRLKSGELVIVEFRLPHPSHKRYHGWMTERSTEPAISATEGRTRSRRPVERLTDAYGEWWPARDRCRQP